MPVSDVPHPTPAIFHAVCVHVCMYVCVCVHMCVYVCIYMCVCMYIYIHIHIYVEGGVRKKARTITGPAALKHTFPVCPSRGWRWGWRPLACALVQMLLPSFTQDHLGV